MSLIDGPRKAIAGVLPRSLKAKIKRMLGIPETILHSDWAVLAPIGPVGRAHTVIDVGAHHGWFFHCWLDWCPSATVYAFDPTRESIDRARQFYGADSRVHLHEIGVGSQEGQLRFNICTESEVSNSFLVPDERIWREIDYRTGAVVERLVPVTTLDRFASTNALGQVYLLKIDVQGFELEVVKGATSLLQRTDYVFVESGIQRLYEGAPSFAELVTHMESQGFHLMHMRAWHRGNLVLVETDMIFRRNGLEPAIRTDVDRFYVELR